MKLMISRRPRKPWRSKSRVIMLKELKLSLMILKLLLFKLVMLSFKFFNIATLDFILKDHEPHKVAL